MEGSGWEEEKKGSSREGMRQMPKSSCHHESHSIDEFVDLDELLRETLPQVGDAVRLIEGQKEADQISSDEAQGGQIRKRMEKENRKKKIEKEADKILSEESLEGQSKKRIGKENMKKKRKRRVSTPFPSQRKEFESDLKKEHGREVSRVRVSENYSGTQQPSTPHYTKASSVEAQERKTKHGKKRRKMGTKDLQRKRSELGFDLLSEEDSNEGLTGDDNKTIMPNGNQSKFLTQKEVWELRLQNLVMETYLQIWTFIKDVYIDTMHSLKETTKKTHS